MRELAPRLGWGRLSSAQLVDKCHCQCVQRSSDVFMELSDSLFRFWILVRGPEPHVNCSVLYSHYTLKHTRMHTFVSSGPESSPAGSPAPACSQQQVIQHNTITTSTTTVGGSSVHGQTNHRTDINPIH